MGLDSNMKHIFMDCTKTENSHTSDCGWIQWEVSDGMRQNTRQLLLKKDY